MTLNFFKPLIKGIAESVILIKADLGYKWSSLPGYFALRKRKNFIKYETVPGYMGKDDGKGRVAYRKFIKLPVWRVRKGRRSVGKAKSLQNERC